MATYRKLHISYWTDPYVEELTQNQKLFYLYLITNTKTKQSGIYEITKKYIAYETGFSIAEVNDLLNHFINTGKVIYSETTNEIAITNWTKHNKSTSPKVLECILKDLKDVKDVELIKKLYTEEYVDELSKVEKPYIPFIEYLLSIYTLSIEYPYTMDTGTKQVSTHIDTAPQQEQEQAQEETQEEKEVQVEEQIQIDTKKVEYFDSLFEDFN